MTGPHGEHVGGAAPVAPGSDQLQSPASSSTTHGTPRSLPICDALHGCITCSDEGVPMHVVEVLEGGALACCDDESGNRSEVMTGIVGEVAVGDTLLVHAGTAILLLATHDGAGA